MLGLTDTIGIANGISRLRYRLSGRAKGFARRAQSVFAMAFEGVASAG